MTGAQILIEALKREGVSQMFGYPGGVVIPIFDALYQSEGLDLLLTRHEQAAVHAADGYARTSGKAGVCLVTSGPGTTNTVTGIATAKLDSSPLVVISGQVKSNIIGSDAFQEVDTLSLMMPICKHNYLVRSTSELPVIIKEAFAIACEGRPGPVSVDIPSDVLLQISEQTEISNGKTSRIMRSRRQGDPHQIHKLADALRKSRKPLLYTGGGIILGDASEALHNFLEKTQIPVVVTMMGLGSVPADHPLFLGMPGMHGTPAANYALTECDLLIGIGVRFDDRVTCAKEDFSPCAVKAQIDIDPSEIGKNIEIDIPIEGDAGSVLNALHDLVEFRKADAWNRQTEEWKKLFPWPSPSDKNGEILPQNVIRKLGTMMDSRGIMVTDVGQHQIWAALYFPHMRPGGFITSGGLGTMGFGLPAGMGASLACPERDVVVICGDGGIQMNIQELATCAVNQIPVKVIVLNNSYLGMVRQWQDLFWNQKYSKTCLKQTPACPRDCRGPGPHCTIPYRPDLVGMAEASGIKGIRVSHPGKLDAALKEALSFQGPILVEIIVKSTENVFPMVPLGGSLRETKTGA